MARMSMARTSTGRTGKAWRRLAPVLAVLVAIALIAGAALLAAGRRSDPARPPSADSTAGNPPVLQLAPDPARAAAAGPAGEVRADTGQGRSAFRLTSALPSTPASAPAYRLAPQRATAAAVSRLGQALEVAGEPRRSGPGWVLESPAGRLVVSDGSGVPWSYGAASGGCLPPLPTGDSGSVTSCPVPLSTAPPRPPSAAGRVAALLARLGPADAEVRRAGAATTATARVAGRVALGLQTTVTLDASARVAAATGHLASPVRLAEYPVIDAGEAFRRLVSQPRMLGLPERCLLVRGQPGCAEPPPAAVTKVELGLQMVTDRAAGALLIPAWIFRIRPDAAWYGREPIGVIGVADRYLHRAVPDSRADPDTAGPPSTVPGSQEPAPQGGGSGPG